jgi:hypothetical protein
VIAKSFSDCLFDCRGTACRALKPLGMTRHAPKRNYFWQPLYVCAQSGRTRGSTDCRFSMEPLAKFTEMNVAAGFSLCHWVLIEQTEKFAGTKRVLQEPQWETDIRPREKLKEAGDPDASYPGEIHQKVPRLPRATELDSFPEGISGPPSGTFRGPPSLLRRRSRHLSPRPAISARPAL